MLGGFLFIINRMVELFFLIPIVGMLAFFVNGYVQNNQLTPNYILVLFIVAVLASAWALVTVLRMDSTRRNAGLVAFIDLCFVGAFIAGVYFLRAINNADCINFQGGLSSSGGLSYNSNSVTLNPLTIDYSPFGVNVNKTCTMLKTSFAFGIMECLFFATTAFLAMMLHRRENTVVVEKTYRRSSHGSRRGHSSHGSHHRHSSRDSRRAYYV